MNDSGKIPNEAVTRAHVEIVRLRTVAFTAQEMAKEIVSRSDAEIARLREELDKAERERALAEEYLSSAREVVKPLLDHYLECYEGNYDDLANAAVAFLERTNCNNS